MTVFRSLTRQFIVISVLLLLFLGINIYSDFIFTHSMKGKAVAIDVAGQLKSRTYEIAWTLQQLAEKDVQEAESERRAELKSDLEKILRSYETSADILITGGGEREIRPLNDPVTIGLLKIIINKWKTELKPVIVEIMTKARDISEQDARELLNNYDSVLYRYNSDVDRLLDLMVVNYEKDIRRFDIFRLCVLGILFASSTVVLLYVRRNVVHPLREFAHAANEIEKGNFDVRIAIANQDEIGNFANHFNAMAARLKNAFDEIRRRSDNMLALNRASNAIMGLTDKKTLYYAVCENGRGLFGFKMVWLGLLKDGTYDIPPVAFAGNGEEYLKKIKVTWDDSPTGAGPTGCAVKTNSPQAMNNLDSAPSYLPWQEETKKCGFKSLLSVPLICARCAVLGVLNFYSDQNDFFDDEKVELCQVYANQAAIAIENLALVEDLEDKVRRRTRELEDAKLIAESANMAKSAFMSNMSHDLRTPLNAVIGFSEALSQGIYGELKPEHKEYIDYIYKSGMNLLKLINEVLDLSRMETGSMTVDYMECNISELINHVMYIFREKIAKHKIRIIIDINEDARMLTADQQKLKQILVSLITDSIMSISDRGTICIRAKIALCKADELEQPQGVGIDEVHDCIRIEISDTRANISEEERSRLFEPYKQFDTVVERRQSNVSLLLSKRFVELHGGMVWAECCSCEIDDICNETCSIGNKFVLLLPIKPLHYNLE